MHDETLKKFFTGDALAASRLMTIVERGGEEGEAILDEIFPRVGRAYRIGMTGIAGAGKSTLIGALALRYRKEGRTVGVIAEDPTSPFTGGAILGDRIRMQGAAGDEGVFIRSIASRGSDTGCSAVAMELADVLDAFGRDAIFIETIGVGQLETRVRFSAHTTCVVLTPDSGDDVQSLKAGLMEIGDVFVVNKTDRADARRYGEDLRSMLELRSGAGDGWLAPVVDTVATEAGGIDALATAIASHEAYLSQNGRRDAKRTEAMRYRMMLAAEEKLKELLWENDYIRDRLEHGLRETLAGKVSPYRAARDLVDRVRIDRNAK